MKLTMFKNKVHLISKIIVILGCVSLYTTSPNDISLALVFAAAGVSLYTD
ncbi:hypothetical protein [Thalassotalea sp. HSM 43]|nr:hypothetical protein [Thalassotalea sp. HSM 43]